MTSLIQSAKGGGTGNAVTATLPAAPTPGSTIVAVHTSRSGQVDTTGWTVARQHMSGQPQLLTNQPRVTILYRPADTNTAISLALADAATAAQALWVGEYDAALVHDSSTATATWTSPPGARVFGLGRAPATRAADSLAIAAYASQGTITMESVGDGPTLRDTINGGSGGSGTTLAVADQTLTGHVEPRATFTTTSAIRCMGVLASFSASPQIDVGVMHATAGALTQTGFVVGTRTTGTRPVRVATYTDPAMTTPTWHGPVTPSASGHSKVHVTGLTPGTTYYWRAEYDGQIDPTKPGKLRTLPTSGNVRFAFASCAFWRDNGQDTPQGPLSEHVVFDSIRDYDPDFFLHTGDLHYQDTEVDDVTVYRGFYDAILESPKQGGMWRHTPWAYSWDDHDFGGNDSSNLNVGRNAQYAAYRAAIPHYPLPFPGPIHQRIDVTDKVRILMPDGRSEADDSGLADFAAKTKLGATGLAWLKSEVTQARQDGIWLLVIMTGTPWISTAPGDNWNAYKTERDDIAAYITAAGMADNVCMAAGDSHAVAIDSGINNQWGGWPVFQAAALDTSGSIKGGPYSEGAVMNQNMLSQWGGHGQYGTFEVTDNGSSLSIDWEGIRVMPWGEPSSLLSYQFTVTAPPAPGNPTPGDPASRALRRLMLL